jgi:L-iditol 2-dehydrogenase
MKAWVLHQAGDIRLENVKDLQPGEGEALVRVKAAGICGSDIPRIYQNGAHRMPLIPGHEISGAVKAVGPGVSDSWRGQRVGIFPLIPCRKCPACEKKKYEMCRSYDYIGSRRDGGFAEYVLVPTWNLLKLTDSVTYEQAAMLEPMAVAVHAVRQISFSGEDTIVVCGLGTIGLLLLMFLLEMPSKKILVVGNKEDQRKTVEKLGLPGTCFCDSRREEVGNWLIKHTEGKGADIFFECVGKNETILQAVFNTAFSGQILLVGNPHSDINLEKEGYWKILRNQLTVKGTWNSSFTHEEEDDWHYALKRLQDKSVSPEILISHRFLLDELEKGFIIMRDKTEEYGKIMGLPWKI